MRLIETTRFSHGTLPHWEVERGRYFVTLRCADSLPAAVVQELREASEALRAIEPRSVEFLQRQRNAFRTAEKYLDAGSGACLFRERKLAEAMAAQIATLGGDGWSAESYCVMPNHVHLLLAAAVASPEAARSLHEALSRLKGRSAQVINRLAGRSGSLWQHEWFDRWIRTDAEWERTRTYIRQNPVKAGLVKDWCDYPWVK